MKNRQIIIKGAKHIQLLRLHIAIGIALGTLEAIMKNPKTFNQDGLRENYFKILELVDKKPNHS